MPFPGDCNHCLLKGHSHIEALGAKYLSEHAVTNNSNFMPIAAKIGWFGIETVGLHPDHESM